MSAAGPAVFLSYASQDAEAARRICDALRAAGVEVWFDQSELRGGDAWDLKIRRQIKECALFVPVISANTQSRREGYFRLEWKLADDRTHLMAKGTPFILPVCIDGTADHRAVVPDSFIAVQWTRLPGGDTEGGFVAHIRTLLVCGSEDASDAAPSNAARVTGRLTARPGRRRAWRPIALTGTLAAGAIFSWWKWSAPAAPRPALRVTSTVPSSVNLGQKSVAVLPFENLSTDRDNAFFADGIHEDVIVSLGKIRDLKVIGRASVLGYRDAQTRNPRQIAEELGVATLLTGSVRRAGDRVVVTIQLIDAQSGAQLAAERYEHALTDIFAIQSAIAQEITTALKSNFTAGERSLIERRPTQNAAAYDLYLRGRLLEEQSGFTTREEHERIVAFYEAAVAEDPAFAQAYAQLAVAHGTMYWFGDIDPTPARRARAEAAVEAARRLAPTAPETHLAVGVFEYDCRNDWQRALAEFHAAEASVPNDAQLQSRIGLAHRRLGQWPETVQRFERALSLNPQNLGDANSLVETLFVLRRYADARRVCERYGRLYPEDHVLREFRARIDYALGGARETYLRARAAAGLKEQREGQVEGALRRGDLDEAERLLADPTWKIFRIPRAAMNIPVASLRAQVAFLRGNDRAARQQASGALEVLRHERPTPRQEQGFEMQIARAEALRGDSEAAIARARTARSEALKQDAYGGAESTRELGEILLIAGRASEALAALKEYYQDSSFVTPRELRDDPLWARLENDPRLAAVLAEVKPL